MDYSRLKDSETYFNLARSFAGESQARNRYQFLEYAARKEKKCALADIIKTLGENEFNHARMFYTYIQKASPNATIDSIEVHGTYPFKEKWNFVENFNLAMEDERAEASEIYPAFAETAKKEGFEEIANLFLMVASVEDCHAKMLAEIHDQLKNDTMYRKPTVQKWKCKECGYEYETKEAYDTCPLCQNPIGDIMLKLSDN